MPLPMFIVLLIKTFSQEWSHSSLWFTVQPHRRRDEAYLFMCLSGTCTSSSEKCLFRFWTILLLLLLLLLLGFWGFIPVWMEAPGAQGVEPRSQFLCSSSWLGVWVFVLTVYELFICSGKELLVHAWFLHSFSQFNRLTQKRNSLAPFYILS